MMISKAYWQRIYGPLMSIAMQYEFDTRANRVHLQAMSSVYITHRNGMRGHFEWWEDAKIPGVPFPRLFLCLFVQIQESGPARLAGGGGDHQIKVTSGTWHLMGCSGERHPSAKHLPAACSDTGDWPSTSRNGYPRGFLPAYCPPARWVCVWGLMISYGLSLDCTSCLVNATAQRLPHFTLCYTTRLRCRCEMGVDCANTWRNPVQTSNRINKYRKTHVPQHSKPPIWWMLTHAMYSHVTLRHNNLYLACPTPLPDPLTRPKPNEWEPNRGDRVSTHMSTLVEAFVCDCNT